MGRGTGLVLLAAGIALAGCFGSGEEAGPEPPADVGGGEFGTAPVKRIDAVRRSPRGLGREPPSKRELALAERIMAANAYLDRLTGDGGEYRVVKAGIVNVAGPDRILGLILDLRLEEAVNGIYELPVVCHGVSGPPFALPPTPFGLSGVSRLLVTVTFADRRVASIDPHNGTFLPAPGAAFMSAPSNCERRAARDVGY